MCILVNSPSFCYWTEECLRGKIKMPNIKNQPAISSGKAFFHKIISFREAALRFRELLVKTLNKNACRVRYWDCPLIKN